MMSGAVERVTSTPSECVLVVAVRVPKGIFCPASARVARLHVGAYLFTKKRCLLACAYKSLLKCPPCPAE